MSADSVARWRLAVMATGLLTLTACAASEQTSRQEPTPMQPISAPAYARAQPPGGVLPDVVAPSPEAVIGWHGDELYAQLGQATLVRRDLGAEIWQYRTDDCVLFVFLYPDGSDTLVRHLDVRGGADPKACLKSVVRANLRQRAG